MSPKFFNQTGFSFVEVLASLVLLGLLSVNIATMFGEIDKTSSKIEKKMDLRDYYKMIKNSLKDPNVCKANFKDLDVNTAFNTNEIFLNATKTINYSKVDENFKNLNLNLNNKVNLYENNYVSDLEIVNKKNEDNSIKIPIYFNIKNGKISGCSTILNTSEKIKSNVCDANTIGATKLSDISKLAFKTTLICNGDQWIAADPSGGMFTKYLQNGGQCKNPNPSTSDCTCPVHYKSVPILGFANKSNCSIKDGLTDHMYNEDTDSIYEVPDSVRGTENCGFDLYVCMPVGIDV